MSDSDLQCNPHQDQSMAHGSDRSRFVDINFSGKRYVYACFDVFSKLCIINIIVEARPSQKSCPSFRCIMYTLGGKESCPL